MVTEIAAVNRMLAHVQMRPVQTLVEPLDPMVAQAKLILEQVSLELQQKGWEWMREDIRTFQPDSVTGEVTIPEDVLAIAFWGRDRSWSRLTVRGRKLYDAANRTYDIGEDTTLDVIVALDWDDLPFAVQTAAMWRAAREFFTAVRGEGPQLASLAASEREAFAEMNAQDIRSTTAMIGDSPLISRTITRRNRWTWVT